MSFRTYTIHPTNSEVASDQQLTLRCDTLEFSQVFEAIAQEEIKVIGQLSNSSNGALLGEVARGNDTKFSVVIKPSSYENPLIDFEWGTLTKREVAAFELSQLLGWDLVPPTVLRDVQDLQCSVQLFIPHDPREHYFNLALDDRSVIERFVLFDYIANNADRKASHLLVEKMESFDFYPNRNDDVSLSTQAPIYGIDHGLTFHEQDKLRTVIWEYGEKPISTHLLADIDRVAPRIEDVLSKFLSFGELQATALRIEKLLINPYHRALDGNPRAFPWPLV